MLNVKSYIYYVSIRPLSWVGLLAINALPG